MEPSSTRFKKGQIPWNKGKKNPAMSGEDHPMFGKKHTEETKKKIGDRTRGKKGINTGRHWKLSEEAKKNIGDGHRGEKAYQYKGGKPKCLDCDKITTQYSSKRCIDCHKKTMKGETSPNFKNKLKTSSCVVCKNEVTAYRNRKYCSMKCVSTERNGKALEGKAYNWIKDRTKLLEKHRLKNSPKWAEWRKYVFERDGYKCLDCGDGGYLEPHHIIPLKVTMEKIFNRNNGITLCRPCHKKTMGKELQLANIYMSLIPAQM